MSPSLGVRWPHSAESNRLARGVGPRRDFRMFVRAGVHLSSESRVVIAACDAARRPSTGRRAGWRWGQLRLRRGAGRRSAVRSVAPTRRSLPSVDRCPRRCTTCGQTARRTRARRPARTRVDPKSRRPLARPRPRSRPPGVVRGTENRTVREVRRRGGYERWAIDAPARRTPSRPTDRSFQGTSLVTIQSAADRSEQTASGTPGF